MSEAAQEDSVKAIRRELMGVRSIAGFMSSEELVKRVDTILNDLMHPSTFAAATSTFNALDEWTTSDLISDNAATYEETASKPSYH